MHGEEAIWRPWQWRRSRQSREPGAALFHGLRIRLTLWYCGVLGTALILFCVVLYLSAQYFLLNPVEHFVADYARMHAMRWVTDFPTQACWPDGPPHPLGPSNGPPQPMLACFDQNGMLSQNPQTAQLPSSFLTNTLAKMALQNGSAHDTVNGGSTSGRIYRYAIAVPNATGHGYVGVVMAGMSIQTQSSLLSTLLVLLILVGGVTLLGAGLGGLFLASRALVPVRLAWERQQRFIADASHELRTPLTLLRADAEVLLRSHKHLETEDVALLEDIVAEAQHMGNLANNMLTLARLDNRSSHQEHEVVNLAEIAHAGARRAQALAMQKEISIQVEANGTTMVIGDPTLLEQAILALLDNAIKYNRHGGQITLCTAIKGECALLEVHDTGIGIAAEHLPHLGERFYRVDKARSREAGGTGLGLAIVQGIAIAHGGTLTLKSVPEQGTTVILTLPLVS